MGWWYGSFLFRWGRISGEKRILSPLFLFALLWYYHYRRWESAWHSWRTAPSACRPPPWSWGPWACAGACASQPPPQSRRGWPIPRMRRPPSRSRAWPWWRGWCPSCGAWARTRWSSAWSPGPGRACKDGAWQRSPGPWSPACWAGSGFYKRECRSLDPQDTAEAASLCERCDLQVKSRWIISQDNFTLTGREEALDPLCVLNWEGVPGPRWWEGGHAPVGEVGELAHLGPHLLPGGHHLVGPVKLLLNVILDWVFPQFPLPTNIILIALLFSFDTQIKVH